MNRYSWEGWFSVIKRHQIIRATLSSGPSVETSTLHAPEPIARRRCNRMTCCTVLLWVLAFVSGGSALFVLLNATVGEATTTSTTTTTTTTRSWDCENATCCKENAKFAEDHQLCDDFYDAKVGIGFTMIPSNAWSVDCDQSVEHDCAVFHDTPPTQIVEGRQAISVSHYQKGASPYAGYGLAYGLAFKIGQTSEFWEYLQACQQKNGSVLINAQCSDGLRCPPDVTTVIPGSNYTYDDFLREKNEIVAITATKDCPGSDPANDFKSNGLSPAALAGVFGVASVSTVPTMQDVCAKMIRSNHTRKYPWPVYVYNFNLVESKSYLRIDHYLNCDNVTSDSVDVVL